MKDHMPNRFQPENKEVVFNQIAGSLAAKYDRIYYVNSESGSYSVLGSNELYSDLEIKESGESFFESVPRNADILVHPKDRTRMKSILAKDHLISSLETKRQYSTDYRLMVQGTLQYMRMSVIWASDHLHFVIGVENINEEVEKEKEQLHALNSANEMARRDELTGAKNKNAYQELEAELQEKLQDEDDGLRFGLIVCDLNNLKLINDSLGHKAGDEYICSFSQMLFDIFSHSPVYRVGGDEFVVFLKGRDYKGREDLFERLRNQILEDLDKGDGPVAATGMSAFDPKRDKKITDIFDRADSMMYADKRRLKERKSGQDAASESTPGIDPITASRKSRLDSLFEAFSVVAEGSYVYLCDMRHDYSRWSKNAVDTFGLPCEYMYHAGWIWEQRIHPEDRESYHAGIEAIFAGNARGHDMQYRALRTDGSYDICTCRGLVINNQLGEPEYFGGVIRNHGLQGHIDSLTGLRNQYGFFEDLRKNMIQNKEMRLCMLGISRFSEINEIYGYQFGNRVIQKFGRYLFEYIGNNGSTYRLEGTRFAVISNSLSVKESQGSYEELRTACRKGLTVDGQDIILEMNAGLLAVDQFDIDEKTIYACLNYAYGESKFHRQGDLVEFYNELSEENRRRIEKIHAIRAAITHGFEGFYLLYQPVVDAESERMTGAEALLRWRSEEFGIVPPNLFIPILENDPLFPALGEWILQTALTETGPLIKEHPHFTVNVNLSYTQLQKPDFLETVQDILEKTGFPPANLCLEITERCRLLDVDLLKNFSVVMRGLGARIALDDFGTGFSSVGLLKDIPVDIIKIDRSFVTNVEQDKKEQEMIGHFAHVAATFDANICVEGIETAGMRDALRKYSIQSFQGYYYSMPIPLKDLYPFLYAPITASTAKPAMETTVESDRAEET